MNRRLTALLALLAFAVSLAVWASGPGARQDIGVLDDAETAALVYMREEEKLARDVYLGLHELWGSLVFANIADAEQPLFGAYTNLLAWFTYDTELPGVEVTANLGDPGQRWLTAQGSYAGAQAELQLFSSGGGIFDQSPPLPVHERVGSVRTIGPV